MSAACSAAPGSFLTSQSSRRITPNLIASHHSTSYDTVPSSNHDIKNSFNSSTSEKETTMFNQLDNKTTNTISTSTKIPRNKKVDVKMALHKPKQPTSTFSHDSNKISDLTTAGTTPKPSISRKHSYSSAFLFLNANHISFGGENIFSTGCIVRFHQNRFILITYALSKSEPRCHKIDLDNDSIKEIKYFSSDEDGSNNHYNDASGYLDDADNFISKNIIVFKVEPDEKNGLKRFLTTNNKICCIVIELKSSKEFNSDRKYDLTQYHTKLNNLLNDKQSKLSAKESYQYYSKAFDLDSNNDNTLLKEAKNIIDLYTEDEESQYVSDAQDISSTSGALDLVDSISRSLRQIIDPGNEDNEDFHRTAEEKKEDWSFKTINGVCDESINLNMEISLQDLQKEKVQLVEDMTILKREAQSQDTTIQTLEQNLTGLKQKYEQKQEETSSVISDLELSIEKLNKERRNLASDISRLQVSLEDAHSQKNILLSKEEQLKEETLQMAEELAIIRKEAEDNKVSSQICSTKDTKIQRLEDKIKDLKKYEHDKKEKVSLAMSAFQKDLQKKDEHISTLQRSMEEVYQERSSLAKDLNSAHSLNSLHSNELDQVQKENSRLNIRVDTLKSKVEESEVEFRKHSALDNKNQKLEKVIASLKQDKKEAASALQQELQVKNDNVISLQSSIEELRQSYSKREVLKVKELEELRDDKAQIIKKVELFEREAEKSKSEQRDNLELRSKVKGLELQVKSKTNHISSLELFTEELNQQIRNLTSDTSRLQESLEDAHAQKMILHSKEEQLKDEKLQMKEELAILKKEVEENNVLSQICRTQGETIQRLEDDIKDLKKYEHDKKEETSLAMSLRQKELQVKNDQISALQKSVQEVSQERSNLAKDLNGAHRLNSLHSDELNQVQKEKSQLSIRVDTLKSKLEESEVENLNTLDKKSQQLESKIMKEFKQEDKCKKKEISLLREELRMKNHDIISLQSTIEEVHQSNNEWSSTHSKELEELRNYKVEMIGKVESLQREAEKSKLELQVHGVLQSKTKGLEQQVKSKEVRISSLELSVDKLNQERRNLTGDVSHFQAALKDAHSQKSIIHSMELDQLKEEKIQMIKQLTVLKREADKCKVLSQRCSTQDAAIQRLENETKYSKRKEEALEKEISLEFQRKNDHITSLESTVEILHQERNDLCSQMSKLQTEFNNAPSLSLVNNITQEISDIIKLTVDDEEDDFENFETIHLDDCDPDDIFHNHHDNNQNNPINDLRKINSNLLCMKGQLDQMEDQKIHAQHLISYLEDIINQKKNENFLGDFLKCLGYYLLDARIHLGLSPTFTDSDSSRLAISENPLLLDLSHGHYHFSHSVSRCLCKFTEFTIHYLIQLREHIGLAPVNNACTHDNKRSDFHIFTDKSLFENASLYSFKNENSSVSSDLTSTFAVVLLLKEFHILQSHSNSMLSDNGKLIQKIHSLQKLLQRRSLSDENEIDLEAGLECDPPKIVNNLLPKKAGKYSSILFERLFLNCAKTIMMDKYMRYAFLLYLCAMHILVFYVLVFSSNY